VEYLRQLLSGIADVWRKLSTSARVNIVVAGLGVAALIAAIVWMGAQPQYVTLSSQLSPQDATKIADELAQAGVPYKFTSNNATVMVPANRRSDMQLLLAQSNLPVGKPVPPGWELFSQNDLMTNQWLQDVKFMRALQGQIQQQLNAFDFVNYSYVLIREAKEELFVSEQKPSEAAVTLEVTRPLSKQEIKGILSIVDHAGGPNLHPGNITIITTTGEVLYLPPQSEFASIANSKLELVTEWEKQREMKLMSKLRELGVRGTATVSARMDFDTKEETTEQVLEGTELSTYTVDTTVETTERLPEGSPGAFANVPEGAAAPGGTGSTETTSEEIINFEPSRMTRKTKTDPGNVVKYLVTLVVEGDYEETTDEQGNKVRTYSGLADERKKMYTDLAMAAVGEGETPTEVVIHDHPFAIEELGAAREAVIASASGEWRDWLSEWAWNGVQIVAIIVGFFMLRVFLRRAVQTAGEEMEAEEPIELPEATREDLRRQEVSREVTRLSTDEPEMVAALLRSWIAEEED
jgi:flagellar M-ring protein FliF